MLTKERNEILQTDVFVTVSDDIIYSSFFINASSSYLLMFKLSDDIQMNCSQFLTLRQSYKSCCVSYSQTVQELAQTLSRIYERVLIISNTSIENVPTLQNFWCDIGTLQQSVVDYFEEQGLKILRKDAIF